MDRGSSSGVAMVAGALVHGRQQEAGGGAGDGSLVASDCLTSSASRRAGGVSSTIVPIHLRGFGAVFRLSTLPETPTAATGSRERYPPASVG